MVRREYRCFKNIDIFRIMLVIENHTIGRSNNKKIQVENASET